MSKIFASLVIGVFILSSCRQDKHSFLEVQVNGDFKNAEVRLTINNQSTVGCIDSTGYVGFDAPRSLPCMAVLSLKDRVLPIYLGSGGLEVFIDCEQNRVEFNGNEGIKNELWNGLHIVKLSSEVDSLSEADFVEALHENLLSNCWLDDSLVPQDSVFRLMNVRRRTNELFDRLCDYLQRKGIKEPSRNARDFAESALGDSYFQGNDWNYVRGAHKWMNIISMNLHHSRIKAADDTLKAQMRYIDSIIAVPTVADIVSTDLAYDYVLANGHNKEVDSLFYIYVLDKKSVQRYKEVCSAVARKEE